MNQEPSSTINLTDLARTLLRIVARLPKTGYSEIKSNGSSHHQNAEQTLDDLADPASAEDTSQG